MLGLAPGAFRCLSKAEQSLDPGLNYDATDQDITDRSTVHQEEHDENNDRDYDGQEPPEGADDFLFPEAPAHLMAISNRAVAETVSGTIRDELSQRQQSRALKT